MRLTKGLYGHEFHNTSKLFGIHCGQMRSHDYVHNGGWYNHLGEKLGWGDLSTQDMDRIMSELQDDEVFIILHEHDSFWNFGKKEYAHLDIQAPGIDYVADKAVYILAPNKKYAVSYNNWEGTKGGLEMISRATARKLLGVG